MIRRYTVPLAITLLTAASVAQATPQATESSHNPAVKSSIPQSVTAPARGSNSFTESQARERLVKAGYLHVAKLMKDNSGAWIGTAMKGSQQVNVALDYKGNITTTR